MATCILAVAMSHRTEIVHRRQELERETRVVARQLAARVQGGLEKHLTALEQMANFFASSRKVTEKEFHNFAATTIRMTPSCLRVAYLEPPFRVRRAYPPGAGLIPLGPDQRARQMSHEAVARARRARATVLTPPMPLTRGSHGFAMATPIFARGQFLGSLVATFRSADYFASMLFPEVSQRYEVTVFDSGVPAFTSQEPGTSEAPDLSVSEPFTLGGVDWEVSVRPKPEVVRGRLGSDQTAFWTLGWLLALAAGALAYAGTFWTRGLTERLASQGVALQEVRSHLDGTREQLIQAEKMTALGELVAGVAHEMNNPLTGIIGYTQLLLRRNLKQDFRKRLETISLEANRMAKIVRNLLAFARRHAPERRLQGLHGIVEKTLELKAYHLRSNQIRVVQDFAPNLPMTMLDIHQIQQVLFNLLNNAEQAMTEAGRGGTVRLATRHVGGRIELRVSDDGPGIPLEIQDRIFEPFFTTKKEGRGTGLGLSLCSGIIQEHGGTIRVESRPGMGATFVIELPVLQDAAAVAEAAPPVSPRPLQPLRILVVDDEPSVQEFLAELLTVRGHKVDSASDAPEALRKLNARPHDLIITDMKMPQGSGLDIYRAVVEKTPQLRRRIIFTTGHVPGEETLHFLQETGNELLFKPCRIEEIESAIARAVRN
jgi:signal transduction histidine kinase